MRELREPRRVCPRTSTHSTTICCWSTPRTGERAYAFVFCPRVVKGVIPRAQLVYCRDLDDLVRFAGPVGRFLSLRGRFLVLIDANGPNPGLIGRYFDGQMPKYSDRPRLGDLAYTEAALFGI
jgi:hypothetical protein